MNQQELDKLLEQHALWLQDPTTGKRANLSSTDLSWLDLRGANLRDAELRGANLSYANLSYADLSKANLNYVNLSNTNLRGADLHSANLRDAALWGANLRDVRLCGADLTNTAGLDQYNICPTGTLIGWKQTAEGNILKLKIPKSAKRCNQIGSRKCRANKAKVLGLYSINKEKLKFIASQHSGYNLKFTYHKGQLLEVADFCDDIRKACAPGIHFFVTFEEAVRY